MNVERLLYRALYKYLDTHMYDLHGVLEMPSLGKSQ